MPAPATTISSAEQGGGDDIYDGGDPGPNGNTVSYPSAINGITIDLNARGPLQISRRSEEPRSAPCWALPYHAYDGHTLVGYAEGIDIGTDVLINIQNVTGGAGNDTIIGDGNANVLNGGAGNDNLSGGAGNDTFNYTIGDGVDTIDGGADSDTLAISGTAGDDTIHVVTSGSTITSIEGMTPTNVESYIAQRSRQRGERRHARLHRHDRRR